MINIGLLRALRGSKSVVPALAKPTPTVAGFSLWHERQVYPRSLGRLFQVFVRDLQLPRNSPHVRKFVNRNQLGNVQPSLQKAGKLQFFRTSENSHVAY